MSQFWDAQCLGSPSHQGELGLEAGAAARLGRALGQHGDLGAEVGAVAAQGRVVVLHVRAQEPLQVPPPPLPLELSLHLGMGKRKGSTGHHLVFTEFTE